MSNVTKDLEKFKKEIDNEIGKSDPIKTKIPRPELVKKLKDVFAKRHLIGLKEQELKFNKEKEKLKEIIEELKRFSPREANAVPFSKVWHEKVIKKIVIEFYTEKVKTEYDEERKFEMGGKTYILRREQCPYCFFFEEFGYLDKLKNLFRLMNLPEYKYKLIIWNTDPLDVFLNETLDPNYTDKLSKEGLNHFYAKGNNIIKFPAIDLIIQFEEEYLKKFDSKLKRGQRPHNFYRVQGVGKSSEGLIYFGGLIEGIMKFLKRLDENVLEKSVLRHKEDVKAQDRFLDKKDYGL